MAVAVLEPRTQEGELSPSGLDLDPLVVAAFRRGEPDAVRDIYRRYAGSVAAVAASVVSDREVVADVVQQTFVKAWKNAESFDVSRDPGPWLRTIARRTAIDAARFEGRRQGVELDENLTAATDDDQLEAAWVSGQVRDALDRLPVEERSVVQLSHLDGLSHPEIAERLGVPVGTVKSRSHRAHRRLASHLRHLRGGA